MSQPPHPHPRSRMKLPADTPGGSPPQPSLHGALCKHGGCAWPAERGGYCTMHEPALTARHYLAWPEWNVHGSYGNGTQADALRCARESCLGVVVTVWE